LLECGKEKVQSQVGKTAYQKVSGREGGVKLRIKVLKTT